MMITDERIEKFIESMEEELPPLLLQIEEEALSSGVPIIRKPARSLLRFLIQLKRPLRLLEVGAAVGFSSIFMSEYLPDGAIITTIEKAEDRIREARRNLRRAKRESIITLLEGDAAEILKELSSQGKSYDFIFMDAAKGQYLAFLPDALAMLEPDGLLISDNVLQDGDIIQSRYAVARRNRTIHLRMREYLYSLMREESLDTVLLPIGDGMSLSLKKKERNGR